MLDAFRSDRTFDNFLEIQERASGVSAPQKKSLKEIRANRRARRQASDDAYEMYQEAKERGEFRGSFFDFLMEHKEEIFALVMKLIALFTA